MEINPATETPYSPPGEAEPTTATHARVRWVILTHLIAVGICLAFSLADRGLLISQNFSRIFYDNCAVLVLPSLLAWIACPIILIVQLTRKCPPRSTRILSVIAETMLCITQFYVLLPSVM